MGARQKLNTAHGCGIVVIALLLAGLFQSWIVFLIVAVVLTLAAVNKLLAAWIFGTTRYAIRYRLLD